LRRLFSRVQLDESEVQILRGVFKHLTRAEPPKP
jgi:tRNA C32,U32 (ribose-2'-O)-methylase TrmJ